MKVSNQTLFYLLLIPAPWFCVDFVPLKISACLSSLLLVRIFTPLSPWLLLPGALYLSYLGFLDYDRRLVPESAISTLNIMLAAKMAQKEQSFRSLVILGFLWTGSFALFNNTIYYLAYLAVCYGMFLIFLKSSPDQPFELKMAPSLKSFVALVKIAPIVIALFFFFPRFRGFLPSANSGASGEIGYSKTVNNSQIAALRLSGKTAFTARTQKKLPQKDLYWRGRSHSKTDGYNWRPQDVAGERSLPLTDLKTSIRYEINYEQDFDRDLVLLDSPVRIVDSSLRHYHSRASNTFKTYRGDKKSRVIAVSNINAELRASVTRTKKKYLELPEFLPKAFQAFSANIKGTSGKEITREFARQLKRQNFTYSLEPGPMPTMADFLRKKTGFCSHFASLLGVVMRHRGVPSRLISGFQGGEYNELGGFYTVRSNDAHVWVEYFENGVWRRVDPTAFVAPSRIKSGLTQALDPEGANNWLKASFLYAQYQNARQYLSNLNYRLALFFDNYDREAQKLLAQSLSLDLKSFYLFGGAALATGLLLLFLAAGQGRRLKPNPEDILFAKFEKKLKRKKVECLPWQSENSLMELCRKAELPSNYLEFLSLYQRIRYNNEKSLGELKKLYKSL